METKLKVYVAGPYTKPDPEQNTRDAIRVGNWLLDLGYAVFVPHLSHYWDAVYPHEYEVWLEHDLQWVLGCDILLRIPGESSGADKEVEFARAQDIEVASPESGSWEAVGLAMREATGRIRRRRAVVEEEERAQQAILLGKSSILLEAQRLTTGDRQGAYGHPLDDYARTAAIWSALLGVPVTPEQAMLCMIGVKLSREVHRHGRDNLTDIAGYANCIQMCIDERQRRTNATQEAK